MVPVPSLMSHVHRRQDPTRGLGTIQTDRLSGYPSGLRWLKSCWPVSPYSHMKESASPIPMLKGNCAPAARMALTTSSKGRLTFVPQVARNSADRRIVRTTWRSWSGAARWS